ncbi:hypothetical protein E1A91_D12G238700v1 [Gossypium mustelinum]|uniref:Secreted protein n=1 Tax=Gossypium mustelinum TaxID=34275 RepID=A0A5D2SH78_GOSMU|nr:hypothetical protein E1A91_D12G238700v1 [Gossypium mustelinum]
MFHFLFLFILCWGHYSICKLVRSIFFIKQTPSRYEFSCLSDQTAIVIYIVLEPKLAGQVRASLIIRVRLVVGQITCINFQVNTIICYRKWEFSPLSFLVLEVEFLTSCLRMTLIRHVNRSNQALRPTLF